MSDLTLLTPSLEPIRFDGAAYSPEHDQSRLKGQLAALFDLMKDGHWRTVDEIAGAIGAPALSISANLRNLRKERFGAHTVNRRWRGHRSSALSEYQLIPAVRV